MLHISLNKFHFIIFTLIRSYQRSHIFRMKYLNIASVNTLLDIHIHICINTHKIIFTDIFDEIFIKYDTFYSFQYSFPSDFFISLGLKKNETTVNFFYENLFLKTIYKTVTDY